MADRRSIRVENRTGQPQNYYLISAGILVSGGVSGSVKLNVAAKFVVGPQQIMQFVVAGDYWAVSGNYRNGRLAVNKAIPIQLGSEGKMGSTVALSVINTAVPDINAQSAGEGKIGNFQLSSKSKSGHEFTFQDALANELFIGIASGGNSESAAKFVLGTYVPAPNAKYQIMPLSAIHVATGDDLKQGQVVKIEDLQNTVAVNFDVRGTNEVSLVHDQYNNFVFKT